MVPHIWLSDLSGFYVIPPYEHSQPCQNRWLLLCECCVIQAQRGTCTCFRLIHQARSRIHGSRLPWIGDSIWPWENALGEQPWRVTAQTMPLKDHKIIGSRVMRPNLNRSNEIICLSPRWVSTELPSLDFAHHVGAGGHADSLLDFLSRSSRFQYMFCSAKIIPLRKHPPNRSQGRIRRDSHGILTWESMITALVWLYRIWESERIDHCIMF